LNLYVANIDFDVNEAALEALFMVHGQVDSTKIIYDKITHQSKGFGFVVMPNDDEATKAIEALNDHELNGRALHVEEARPQR